MSQQPAVALFEYLKGRIALLERGSTVAFVTHAHPDLDAIASVMLGQWFVAQQWGESQQIETKVFVHGKLPEYLSPFKLQIKPLRRLSGFYQRNGHNRTFVVGLDINAYEEGHVAHRSYCALLPALDCAVDHHRSKSPVPPTWWVDTRVQACALQMLSIISAAGCLPALYRSPNIGTIATAIVGAITTDLQCEPDSPRPAILATEWVDVFDRMLRIADKNLLRSLNVTRCPEFRERLAHAKKHTFKDGLPDDAVMAYVGPLSPESGRRVMSAIADRYIHDGKMVVALGGSAVNQGDPWPYTLRLSFRTKGKPSAGLLAQIANGGGDEKRGGGRLQLHSDKPLEEQAERELAGLLPAFRHQLHALAI